MKVGLKLQDTQTAAEFIRKLYTLLQEIMIYIHDKNLGQIHQS